ncbi:MAG TPA: hypothetical protein PKA41_15880 [Verrucomicrobiota bacterium]|nr:hypothetical protein [Verrucomicrobiota bacterium]
MNKLPYPRLRCLCLLLVVLSLQSLVHAIPSFSGAEGWGAIATGGRGGSVVHVTNLNDSGPGSFRAALEAAGPRTVVFDVSGIITLNTEISVTNGNLTIAGETAPGDGVIIAGETVSMDTTNIIVRYMRFRRGTTAREDDSFGPDRTPGNIIIDHVSASWGYDENISIYRNKNTAGNVIPTHNVTIQWTISSEALNLPSPDHPFGHAFGSTLGGKGVNYHHNLWACNTGRNPSLSFSHFIDFRNNVLFNWQHRSMDGAGPEAHVNVINNYYKPGPATGRANNALETPIPELKVRIVEPEIRQGVSYGGVGWWFVQGNVVEGYTNVTADNWEGLDEVAPGVFATGVQFEQPFPVAWARVLSPHTNLNNPGPYPFTFPDPRDPFDTIIPPLPRVATQTAQDALQSVLSGAGATLPVRDAVDLRVATMVASGIATNGPKTNGIVNLPSDVGGYPAITVVSRAADWDTDGDGMPDHWELEHGLDPNDAADRNDDFDNDGYTNLQDYLNELGAFAAVQAIHWDGETNNRYAQIENWDIAFQPSRFDTAIISNAIVWVDAIGQDAGTLQLVANTTLNITNGWLKIADSLIIESNCTAAVSLTGRLNVAGSIVNNGTLRLTGAATMSVDGALTNNGILDIMSWNGSLPAEFVNNGTLLDRRAIRVDSVAVDAAGFQATIQGYAGHNYQLQLHDDSLNGNWTKIGGVITGTNAPITLTHPGGTAAGRRFYRVAVD